MKTATIRIAFLVWPLVFTNAWGNDEYERALIFDLGVIETPREYAFHGEVRCVGPGFQLFVNHPNPFGRFHRYTGECGDPVEGVIYDARVDLRDGTVEFVGFERALQSRDREQQGTVIHFRGSIRGDRICGSLVTADVERGTEDVSWSRRSSKVCRS